MVDRSSTLWNPARYARHARFVAELGMPVVELLAPVAGETILDLGCGDGALTRVLADAGCRVTGVDASPAMVAAAAALGLDAQVMDGRALGFDESFDAVFSNAALHWMRTPAEVFTGVWRALKPGGRFVAECGGDGNVATLVWALETALARRGIAATGLNPWVFMGRDECHRLLTRAGFAVATIELFPRPTPLPTGVAGWVETFAQSYLGTVPPGQRADLIAEVVELCRPTLFAPGDGAAGSWTADYVRLRFRALKLGAGR